MTTPLETMRAMGPHLILASPQAKALGLEVVAIEPAEATLRLPYRDDLVGDPDTGVISGGAVTTLLDHTCGQAVWAALTEYTSIATLDLRIDYMRPAEPGLAVVAHAHCYKLTRSVAFVRAQAYDSDAADPVATAQATFMLDSNAGRAAGANRTPEANLAPEGGV
ncbi:MAG TPA: PaaI family thioesterase [Caulobacteraceae bacterium]|nr:PaaI family thioesterase [Caulobacteraceae bacterium]